MRADQIFYGSAADKLPLAYPEVESKLRLLGKKLEERKDDLPEDLLFEFDIYSILRGPMCPRSNTRPVLTLTRPMLSDHLVPEIAAENADGDEIFITDQSDMSLREILEEGSKKFADFPFSLQAISDRADELLRQWG